MYKRQEGNGATNGAAPENGASGGTQGGGVTNGQGVQADGTTDSTAPQDTGAVVAPSPGTGTDG